MNPSDFQLLISDLANSPAALLIAFLIGLVVGAFVGMLAAESDAPSVDSDAGDTQANWGHRVLSEAMHDWTLLADPQASSSTIEPAQHRPRVRAISSARTARDIDQQTAPADRPAPRARPGADGN
jgi:hypothetical protein